MAPRSPSSRRCPVAETLWIELCDGPLPWERLHTFIGSDSTAGGVVTFVGVTRSEHDAQHGALARLEYEAYMEMARQQMRELSRHAQQRWKAGRVAMLHRLGPVGVGEASVAIAVACPHRAESFEACRWLIDALKRDVPIWKKDVFADGFTRWVDPGSPCEPRT